MSFEIAWPARWAPDTEATICDRMNKALSEAKVDPSLIRGKFEVKGVSLGSIAPHVMLMGVESASMERAGVQLCFQYCGNTDAGFNITIGGANVGLTGAEGDGDTFTQSKLWYPFEATLYNIRIKSSVKLEGVHQRGVQRYFHKPPPASALQELQLGRLRAARAPTSHPLTPPPPVVVPPPSSSPPLTKSLLREVEGKPVSKQSSTRSTAQSKGAGFGLAYASRRVHYPKWPRGDMAGRSTSGTAMVTPSLAPLTPGVSLIAKGSGLRSIPSLLSLEGGSYSTLNAPSSPTTSIATNEHKSPERRVSGSCVSSSLQDKKSIELRVTFRGTPEIDFSLRTNFFSLKGADDQIRAILKSLLKPKLEMLAKGIVVHLPDGQVEFGPPAVPHAPESHSDLHI
eukprot:TRINITY_DN37654_c0_g1_i1.p1 TRINITY_DN37654_c0_g1~~TRINITY_DN37654_c0_g1_i1.p1  ORF type:complete len:398 (+),score=57.94 TRINITY_DN37654_c0_g1_i1:79-1272(+)